MNLQVYTHQIIKTLFIGSLKYINGIHVHLAILML